MDPIHLTALAAIRDFYWYSPVLRKQLDGKVADVAVQPLSAAEINGVLRYCHAHDLPVTVRGAGTGNYGQAVPLHRGVVLDLARMDRIDAIQPDGVAVRTWRAFGCAGE